MKNRYSRAIERVEVTPEMRARIMKNLSGAASENKRNKAPFFRAYRKYISIAACFLLLIAGAFVVYNSFTGKGPIVGTTPPPIADFGSLGELSDAVGFKVPEVKTFPFDVQQVTYTSYFGTLAQVRYTGEGNELSLRMSVGSEDNSGDYTEYGDIKTCTVNDLAVTLKGSGGLYNLALWNSGGYSYSIRIAKGDSMAGISEEEILDIVLSVE